MSMPAIVLVVVVLVSLSARRSQGGAVLGRLRALVPGWRFFDAIEPTPRLSVRVGAGEDSLGAWLDVIPLARRAPLLAAHSNLALAMHGLVERLVGDGDDAAAVAVTWAQITELARARARREVGCGVFQWKVADHDGARLERARSEVMPL